MPTNPATAPESRSRNPDRRQFVKASSAALAGGAALTSVLPVARAAHNSVKETLRIGLIGCGGRGSGAVINACMADKDVRVTALADAFPDRLQSCLEGLQASEDAVTRALEVTKENQFTGTNCHVGLINSGVDVVLLCSPPYFRPAQMEAAVAAGKHIFCEKPIAVDAPGVRRVMKSSELCKAKGLSLVSGLCWRYDLGVNATMERIKAGEIGDVRAIESNYVTGELWHRGNNPQWSKIEYQLRNWLYFAWLSGDIPAEQHIHTLDKALWVMGDKPPARCWGTGGRQKRTDAMYGNTYDHFATVFEWENGVKCFSHCRQMNNCFNENECHVYGTTGKARILRNEIEAPGKNWRYSEKKPSMYDVEHVALFKSIREGKPINNGEYMCNSTMMAIMAREASYTGKAFEWEQMWNDEKVLGPSEMQLESGDFDPGPVPVPGIA
jgi:predicted dehydrogenase